MAVKLLATSEKDSWPYKLLDRERHARLVADLPGICEIAGVPLDMIDKSMADSGCSSEEIEWVTGFRLRSPEKDNQGGLVLIGTFDPDPTTRLMAMAAAFLRNFIDARVLHLFSINGDDWPDPTVLIIPDFCRSSSKTGHSLTQWQARALQSMTMERFKRRLVTILHVESLVQIEMEHGKSFRDFIANNWDLLKNG